MSGVPTIDGALAIARARYDLFLQLQAACGHLADDQIHEVIAFAKTLETPATDACPGDGRCHGAMVHCDRCGDVGKVCDDIGCNAHACQTCQDHPVEIDPRTGFGDCGRHSYCPTCGVETQPYATCLCYQAGEES